ncbi:DUF1573 domain-containing protein [Bacteroides sp. 224]|uniref:DUF1573 domain-containing protein n=1 Tax=Bacteroides sp. 224 TaxID=2302936 RepID=UPI0013D2206F|nr:DUF1573 domain-containing protein [Bacteroides sp. 224]
MKEAELQMLGQVSFLFYFHPKNKAELQTLLMQGNFRQIIFADHANKLNELNDFPDEREYQCFLLNEKNQVVLIGNPAINPKLWDIYKQAVMGENLIQYNKVEKTTIEIKQTEIELEELSVHETTTKVFVLKNTGNAPLLINNISSSCGCTVPEWDKHPINSGDSTEIKVKVTPDVSGFFRKSIKVSCNIQEEVIQLVVRGMIKE